MWKAYMELKDFEKAESNANSAYEKAVGIKYSWAEGDAADLLGEMTGLRQFAAGAGLGGRRRRRLGRAVLPDWPGPE